MKGPIFIVDSMCQLPEVFPLRTKTVFQGIDGPLAKLTDGANAELLKDLAPLFPDTPEPLDGQRIKELFDLIRLHDQESIGLLDVAGDLGQTLVGGHTNRDDQADFFPNDFLDLLTNLRR